MLIGRTRKDRLLCEVGNDTLRAKDGVRDVVEGGAGGRDRASVDDEDSASGVETFL